MNVPNREAETIAACATAPGAAALAVVRVSGPRALELAERIAGSRIEPRAVQLRRFRAIGGETIDRGLVLYFPPPGSFTGEAVVEFQCHGGPIVVDWLLETLFALGARPAEPGEFSLRAFLNDRLDLTQAEAIADLIGSGSRTAARAALRSLDGAFAERVQAVQAALTELRVLCEAWLDFPDEEIEPQTATDLDVRVAGIDAELARIEAEAGSGRVLTDGLTVVLAGAPNVGKSSLLNRLAAVDAAIVSEVPGTTRDALERRLVVAGIPLDMIDTAGLRESADPVERAGIARARRAIEKADLVLWIADARGGAAAAAAQAEVCIPPGTPCAIVLNKVDLLPGHATTPATDRPTDRAIGSLAGPVATPPAASMAVSKAESSVGAVTKSAAAETLSDPVGVLAVSAFDGTGLDALAMLIADHGGAGQGGAFSARRRHLAALAAARRHLALARHGLDGGLEVAAEELRAVQLALSELTGAVTSDELLGEIFSSFCIGK